MFTNFGELVSAQTLCNRFLQYSKRTFTAEPTYEENPPFPYYISLLFIE